MGQNPVEQKQDDKKEKKVKPMSRAEEWGKNRACETGGGLASVSGVGGVAGMTIAECKAAVQRQKETRAAQAAAGMKESEAKANAGTAGAGKEPKVVPAEPIPYKPGPDGKVPAGKTPLTLSDPHLAPLNDAIKGAKESGFTVFQEDTKEGYKFTFSKLERGKPVEKFAVEMNADKAWAEPAKDATPAQKNLTVSQRTAYVIDLATQINSGLVGAEAK